MKQKHLSTIIALGVVLIFLVSGCALFPGLVAGRYKTFTITVDGKPLEFKLPKELPDIESAIYNYETCFNLTVCMQRFCLSEEASHDHIDFLYTNNSIIGLVWLNTIERQHIVWVYVDGIPVSATIEEMIELIESKEKKLETLGVTFRI